MTIKTLRILSAVVTVLGLIAIWTTYRSGWAWVIFAPFFAVEMMIAGNIRRVRRREHPGQPVR